MSLETKLPVYVVTGFLDAGKTTFINNLLNRADWSDSYILIVRFETGDAEFCSTNENFTYLSFMKKELEQNPGMIEDKLLETIVQNSFDEIWIEWNGTVPFSKLQNLLLSPSLRNLFTIHKVINVSNGEQIENILGKTGEALPEQISNSNIAVVRNADSSESFKRIRNIIRNINPDVHVCRIKSYKNIYKHLFKRDEHSGTMFFLAILAILFAHLVMRPFLEMMGIPVNTVINIFLGIILQALPFLMIGVLLSSFIQIFVPKATISRRFPKSPGLGILTAIVGGFFLPVCDCASIPIFRSLVRKGVPVSAAVTFMTVSPIINPVVILSTYYAFSGNMTIVLGRICLGIISSVIIGFSFELIPPKKNILNGGVLDGLMCSCGCYEDVESVTTLKGKLLLFLRHSQAEFFDVGKYLIIGTFISSLFQAVSISVFVSAQSGTALAISMIIMMIMAFVLSLCSSSDAVVARSFANQFPAGALMGFLVFGPMMDIKNVMMLSSGFSKSFIGRFLFTSFVVCFLTVFLFANWGGM
ncbi:permease [Sedimentibacter hydroxybenzoicus DSM 7310]|uniref:Permease n=1 Tax=Sedimentibacter hydroxybenzoicus DSM 7310 TaxID=1123245 RepID=A0A974BM72_SEDHY|nr:permease [Sedimentibacter hydroxybenzoicus]NYB75814.1 permease [Sedimentibacter hydroxybenzoicus DSM 7310]